MLPALLGLLCWQAEARAGTFEVKPVQIHLPPGTSTALITIQNLSNAPMRFQLSAASWQEAERGEMRLAPTQDVVFFPSLLALAPGQQRMIRVGVAAPAEARERTYRLFVEELPQLHHDGSRVSNAVQVRTRMSVPIFVEPAQPAPAARIASLALVHGRVVVRVANPGNAHFRLRTLKILGRGRDGSVRFAHDQPGWYVLGGATREFQIPLAPSDCAQARTLELRIDTDAPRSPAAATLALSPRGCRG